MGIWGCKEVEGLRLARSPLDRSEGAGAEFRLQDLGRRAWACAS